MVMDTDRVTFAGQSFEGLSLSTFAAALAEKAPSRPATTQGTQAPVLGIDAAEPNAPLTNDEMTRQIQSLITSDTTLTAETGDSWFNASRMPIPGGARVELEMQWGHIGWSVPSAFGNAVGSPERRHIMMVGDGSFQLTAQEVAQMIRYEIPVIIFLINNRGYVIEIAIHDGPYNYIKNWNYAGLIDVFNDEDGHGLGLKASTGAELEGAIKKALDNRRGPTLIECNIAQDDCTETLIAWGKRVAATNSRKPQA